MKRLWIIFFALVLSIIVLVSVVALIVRTTHLDLNSPEDLKVIAAFSGACFAGLAFFGVISSALFQIMESAKARQIQKLTVLAIFAQTLPIRIAYLERNDRQKETKPLRKILDGVFDEIQSEHDKLPKET